MNQLETWGRNVLLYFANVWRSAFWTTWMEACTSGLFATVCLLMIGGLFDSTTVFWVGIVTSMIFSAGIFAWMLRIWPGLLVSVIGYMPKTARFAARDIHRQSGNPISKGINMVMWIFLFPFATVFTWWEELVAALVTPEPC